MNGARKHIAKVVSLKQFSNRRRPLNKQPPTSSPTYENMSQNREGHYWLATRSMLIRRSCGKNRTRKCMIISTIALWISAQSKRLRDDGLHRMCWKGRPGRKICIQQRRISWNPLRKQSTISRLYFSMERQRKIQNEGVIIARFPAFSFYRQLINIFHFSQHVAGGGFY